MAPTLIGYFPKERAVPPPWMAELRILEVGSVSLCNASGPDGWINAWKHNDWGFFDDPDSAWSVVSPDDRGRPRMLAYDLHPAEFIDGVEQPIQAPSLDVAPLGRSFRFLGWDVVSRSTGDFFECSPLSCNLLAKEVPTNSACLLPHFEAARSLASTAEADGCSTSLLPAHKPTRHVLDGCRLDVSRYYRAVPAPRLW
jgi:hypothetical protein